MRLQAKWIMVLGALLMMAGCFLPWLSRGGRHVQGFDVTSFGYPALVIAFCAGIVGLGSLGIRVFDKLQPYLLFVISILAILNLWRAYRLGAIGLGLGIVFLGIILAVWAYFRSKRE